MEGDRATIADYDRAIVGVTEGDSCIKSPNHNVGKDFTSPLKTGPAAMRKRKIVEDSYRNARDYSSMENLRSFRCTPLRQQKLSSCPSIKGIFGKLKNDLSAVPNKNNLQNDPRVDHDLPEPSVIGQRDQFRAQFLKSQDEIPNQYGDPTVSNTSLLDAAFTHFSENLSSKGVTEDHEIGLMFPTAVEGEIEIT